MHEGCVYYTNTEIIKGRFSPVWFLFFQMGFYLIVKFAEKLWVSIWLLKLGVVFYRKWFSWLQMTLFWRDVEPLLRMRMKYNWFSGPCPVRKSRCYYCFEYFESFINQLSGSRDHWGIFPTFWGYHLFGPFGYHW